MSQSRRLAGGGRIDRGRKLVFTFDGVRLEGFAGDSVASALLANDRHRVARSIRFHRARGILSAGLEEPNALVACRKPGDIFVPNLKATEVALTDNLEVRSQNAWPSLACDAGALLQLGSAVLGAGFYYKTFMWPRRAWQRLYEKIIRRAAGQGRAAVEAGSALYDKRYLACDLLIVGSGPAGLAAAEAAAESGCRLLLLERDREPGGSALWEQERIGSQPLQAWCASTLERLGNHANLRILCNTLACGRYDHGRVVAVETPGSGIEAIAWRIRARHILLACGATEQPLLFRGNDLPGIMLASAVRQYVYRYAVAPGRRALLAIADPAERDATRRALLDAGIEVTADLGDGERILAARGRRRLRAVDIRSLDGRRQWVNCDLLCVSAGWSPNAQLLAQAGTRLEFDRESGVLQVPERIDETLVCGGARGLTGLAKCIADGARQARNVTIDAREDGACADMRLDGATVACADTSAFVDLQNDVRSADLELALVEGYDDVELAKRYTTLGMGTDQGKTAWPNALRQIDGLVDGEREKIGHTTFRPPISPVPFGSLVGAEGDNMMTPVKHTPFHAVFAEAGCIFEASGDWLYSRYFPRPGEDMARAVAREVNTVRECVGCVDMSTLGKVEVHGADALEFLSRIYCNDLDNLQPGRVRYALMLREDGILFDDGTVSRLDDESYLVTMTSANADAAWRWMSRLLQCDWPDLDARLTRVSDQWASLAIAGPEARRLLAALKPDFDVDRETFPFASVREGRLGAVLPCRVFRISFSGELSYEINVPAGFAGELFHRVRAYGADLGLAPYGLEALDVLRIEKGHVSIGSEIDGRSVPSDLGLGGLVSRCKPFVGSALLQRPELRRGDRPQLVGLTPIDKDRPIPPGAVVSGQAWREAGIRVPQGRLTATIDSPTLGHSIALALLENGHSRHGERLWAVSPIAGTSLEVSVGPPCFFDPEGKRTHA